MHPAQPPPPHQWAPHPARPAPKPSTTLALTAILLAAVGAAFAWMPFLGVLGLLMAIAGLIIGIVARRRIARGVGGGRGMATSAVVVGIVGVLLGVGGVVLSVLLVKAEQERIATTRAYVEVVDEGVGPAL